MAPLVALIVFGYVPATPASKMPELFTDHCDFIFNGEPEARLLPVLCRSHKTSLDIGGNEGAYAVLMRRWSRRCVVFEPNIVLANRLRDGFLFDRRIAVRGEALSDHAGSAVLRIPMHEGEVVTGLASIDGDNRLGGLPFQSIEVARRRLQAAFRTAPSSRWREPHLRMASMTGTKLLPLAVRRYSTLGGTIP